MIAAMQMAEIGDESLTGITPMKPAVTSKQWKDIGWFKDEKGYIKWGVIPEKNNMI
jgi:hypothetical protein